MALHLASAAATRLAGEVEGTGPLRPETIERSGSREA